MTVLDLRPGRATLPLPLESKAHRRPPILGSMKPEIPLLVVMRRKDIDFSAASTELPDFSKHLPLLSAVLIVLLAAGGAGGVWIYARQQAVSQVESAGLSMDADGLRAAIEKGDADLLPAFSRLGVKVSGTGRVIESALVSASPAVLEQVFAKGAQLATEPNAARFLPYAIKTDDPKLLAVLLANGVTPDGKEFGGPVNLLEIAATNGKWNIARWLLENRPKTDFNDGRGDTAAMYFVTADSADLIALSKMKWGMDYLAANDAGDTPLHIATKQHEGAAITALLNLGADPLVADHAGVTPLQIAVHDARDDTVAAFVSAKGEPVATALMNDVSPLIEAGMANTISKLVDLGSLQPDSPLDNGMTPQIVALTHRQHGVAQILIDKGADPNRASTVDNIEGITPLMIAAVNRLEATVSLLVAKGADTAATAANGFTAQMAAQRGGSAKIMELLTLPKASPAPQTDGPGTAQTTVRAFYEALSSGDGEAASKLIVPEKRQSGPFAADNITHFYGSLAEPLSLRELRAQDDNQYFAAYTFRSGSRRCDGRALVTTTQRDGLILIESIHPLDGC